MVINRIGLPVGNNRIRTGHLLERWSFGFGSIGFQAWQASAVETKGTRPDRNESTMPSTIVKITRKSASLGSVGTKMRSTLPSSLTLRSSLSPSDSTMRVSDVPMPKPDRVVIGPDVMSTRSMVPDETTKLIPSGASSGVTR